MLGAKFIAGTGLSIVLLLATPASAQSAPDQLALDLVVDTRYDSNVLNISDNRADALNVDRNGWVINPALRLTANKALGPHQLTASAVAGYDFYTTNSDLNRERLSGQIGGLLNFSACEVSPTISLSRQRSEYSNYYTDVDPLEDLQNTQTTQNYGLGLSCGGVLGLRPEAGISYTKGDNTQVRRQFSDYGTVTGRLGLGYRHPSFGTLSAYYSKAKTTYDNRIIAGKKQTYEVDRIGLSAQRDIGARMAWDGAVYYITTSSSNEFGSDNGFEGLGYNVGLNFRASQQLRTRLFLGRDVQTSLNSDALYTVDNRYGITVDYAASDFISLNAGYTRVDRDLTYSTFFGPIPIEILQEEKLDTVDAGITYRRTNRLALTLYGGYEKRSADRELFNYDGYFVGLRATLGLLR